MCSKQFDTSDKRRSIPDLDIVQHFLQPNTEFRETLQMDDHVCYTCYKSHLVLVKHVKQIVCSTDSDLLDLVCQVKHSKPRISDIKTWDNVVDYVMKSLAVSAGETLLKQTAILLPQLYVTFKDSVQSLKDQLGIITDRSIPSHLWLRIKQTVDCLYYNTTWQINVVCQSMGRYCIAMEVICYMH